MATLKKYLPIGVAALAGGLLWYYSRKAKAAPAPLPPPGPPTEGPPVEPPAPTPEARRDAPPYRGTVEQETFAAANQAARFVGAVGDAMTANGTTGDRPTDQDIADARRALRIPRGQSTASFLADQAYKELYPRAYKIPPANERGSGWKKYINAWKRMHTQIKKTPWTRR